MYACVTRVTTDCPRDANTRWPHEYISFSLFVVHDFSRTFVIFSKESHHKSNHNNVVLPFGADIFQFFLRIIWKVVSWAVLSPVRHKKMLTNCRKWNDINLLHFDLQTERALHLFICRKVQYIVLLLEIERKAFLTVLCSDTEYFTKENFEVTFSEKISQQRKKKNLRIIWVVPFWLATDQAVIKLFVGNSSTI